MNSDAAMETANLDSLDDRLQRFVGRSLSTPRVARDAVNAAMIRHFCDAMGDANPVYTDPLAAAASVHGEIVAPPAMVRAWTMPGLGPVSGERADDGQAELFALLDANGFTSVVATNADDEYHRYLRLGDMLTLSATFEAVSPLKKTALGAGYFVDSHHRWHDQLSDLVASSHIRVLKFAPSEEPRDAPVRPLASLPGPAASERRPGCWSGTAIAVGDALGDLIVEITPTLIISTAIATRDYQDVHHDRDLAQRRGSQDIFMNILTTQGLLERYVTEWAGQDAMVKRIKIRLGAPNYPYDTMVVRGRVASITGDPARPLADIETVGTNSLGDHVVGTLTVQLPGRTS